MPAAVPPSGHNFVPKSRTVYQKWATSPPARSRHPPVHTILDSDSSDAEARPQWSYFISLATTQGSLPSRRYSSGIPTTQRPRIPGTSARVLRIEAGFYLSVRTSILNVERPDLRLATPAKRLQQRPRGISRFHRRRAGLLVRCGHRHDPHLPRHRETGDSNPSLHCNCLRPDERTAEQPDPGISPADVYPARRARRQLQLNSRQTYR